QLRLAFDDFDYRRALDAAFLQNSREHRGLEDAEADIEPDRDHDDREPERDAPSPCEKLIARDGAESQHREVGKEQPGGAAPLRPRGNETGVGSRPFHRHQCRAAPFAADAETLNKAYG